MRNIQKELDDYLLKEQSERGAGSGKWTPSSFGRCYRFQYWKRACETPTNPPEVRSLRVFKVGNLFHKFVQDIVGGEKEVKVELNDLIGYADIVTEDEVIDIKSQHSRAFWYMRQADYNIKEEKFQNILQLTTYAILLKKPKARLVFVSKDDLCIYEYEINPEEFRMAVVQEVAKLRVFWDFNTLPPAEPRAYGNKECYLYCLYRDKCFMLEGENHPCMKAKKNTTKENENT